MEGADLPNEITDGDDQFGLFSPLLIGSGIIVEDSAGGTFETGGNCHSASIVGLFLMNDGIFEIFAFIAFVANW